MRPPAIKVFLKREEDIAVCKLHPKHKWFWSSCWKETRTLIGMDLEPDECVMFDLRASNVVRLGKVTESSLTVALNERWPEMRIPIFNSNKTQIGVLAAWGIPLVGFLVHKIFPEISLRGIHVGMICATAIVCAHVIGYAITDGLVHFGKGETKSK